MRSRRKPEGAKSEVLADGVNPKSIAAELTQQRWRETRGGFNRKLVYEPLAWLGLAIGLAYQLREQQQCDCSLRRPSDLSYLGSERRSNVHH
jgi:hypothetical protein